LPESRIFKPCAHPSPPFFLFPPMVFLWLFLSIPCNKDKGFFSSPRSFPPPQSLSRLPPPQSPSSLALPGPLLVHGRSFASRTFPPPCSLQNTLRPYDQVLNSLPSFLLSWLVIFSCPQKSLEEPAGPENSPLPVKKPSICRPPCPPLVFPTPSYDPLFSTTTTQVLVLTTTPFILV